MFNSFSIKNFRVFKDKASFKMKPLTIFTGPNNSGKSSINKSLLLLKNVLSETIIKQTTVEFPLDIKSGPLVKIGKLSDSLSDSSNSTKLEYVFHYLVGQSKIPIKIAFSINTKFPVSDNYYHAEPVLDEVKIMYNNALLIKSELIQVSWPKGFRVKKIDFLNFIAFFNELKEKETCKSTFSETNKVITSDDPSIIELHSSILNFLLVNNLTLFDLFHEKSVPVTSLQEGDLNDSLYTAILKTFSQWKIPDMDDFSSKDITLLLFSSLFSQNHTSNSLSGNAFKNYSQILDSKKDQVYPRFIELIQHINSIYVFLINEFKTDIMSFEYVPHTKFSQLRGIPLHENNWIQKNLFNYKDQTSIYDEFQNIDISSNSNEFKDDDTPFFTKWQRVFGLDGFQLNISKDEHEEFIHIFLMNYNKGIKRHISDLGTAYGHILMLLIVLANTNNDASLIIEEPEANLHPKFQSLLADAFVDFIQRAKKIEEPLIDLWPYLKSIMPDTYEDLIKQSKKKTNSLVIETHSEYLIRKLQFLIAKGECKPEDVIIYYIDDPDPSKRETGAPQVREITIDKFGRMSQDFGKGFFDEADNLAIQLFQLNQQNFN